MRVAATLPELAEFGLFTLTCTTLELFATTPDADNPVVR